MPRVEKTCVDFARAYFAPPALHASHEDANHHIARDRQLAAGFASLFRSIGETAHVCSRVETLSAT